MFKGKVPPEMLPALLEALPVEFSITDAEDKVLAWNRHETRMFKRGDSVLGRDVRSCHPKKSLEMVEKILSEMRAGTRDSAEFWLDMQLEGKAKPEKIYIQYFALRNESGKFVGCLECTQKLGYVKSLKGQRRLLD